MEVSLGEWEGGEGGLLCCGEDVTVMCSFVNELERKSEVQLWNEVVGRDG